MIVRRHFEAGETAVTIVAEEELIQYAKRSIFDSRNDITAFIERDEFFKVTFDPYDEPESAPAIVKRMCDAARTANVGPMAAVAGAIGETAVQAMMDHGADHAIIDNGGDIAMVLNKDTAIGIFAGTSSFKGLAYMMKPTEGIYGVCTSSGRVGPSISLGISDAATVFAKNVALADACATALGNLVTSSEEKVLEKAVASISVLNGVDGCVAMIDDKMAMGGKVPDLVPSKDSRCRVSERYL